MMGMPGGGPRPMHFPGGYPNHPQMHMPLAAAARNHDQLVQDFKDLLLETKVCYNLTTCSWLLSSRIPPAHKTHMQNDAHYEHCC